VGLTTHQIVQVLLVDQAVVVVVFLELRVMFLVALVLVGKVTQVAQATQLQIMEEAVAVAQEL
jgi:hypothetical protein